MPNGTERHRPRNSARTSRIKRGKHGRVVNIPSVASIREEDRSFSGALRCVTWRLDPAPCKTGSRAAGHRQARLAHCCSLLSATRRRYLMSREDLTR